MIPSIFNHKAVFISFILCLHLYSFIHDRVCRRFISPFIGVCCQYLFQCRYIQLSFPESSAHTFPFKISFNCSLSQAFSPWRCAQRFSPWALFVMRTHTSGQIKSCKLDIFSNDINYIQHHHSPSWEKTSHSKYLVLLTKYVKGGRGSFVRENSCGTFFLIVWIFWEKGI